MDWLHFCLEHEMAYVACNPQARWITFGNADDAAIFKAHNPDWTVQYLVTVGGQVETVESPARAAEIRAAWWQWRYDNPGAARRLSDEFVNNAIWDGFDAARRGLVQVIVDTLNGAGFPVTRQEVIDVVFS